MKFLESAFKHTVGKGNRKRLITKEDIIQVISDPMMRTFELPYFEDDYQEMIVGHMRDLNMLEVGVRYATDGTIIFHAREATTFYLDKWGNSNA